MVTQRLGAMMCVVALALAAPAWAQTSGGAAPASKIGARAFVHFEAQAMTAKDTFDAVFATTTMKGLGGGGEVDSLWRGVFARVSVSRFSKTGQRVFVYEGTAIPLGIPLDVAMTPIELAAGWRFKALGSRGIVPYVGGGAVFLKYSESSSADASGESINESYSGMTLFGGVEVPVWRRVAAGAEVGWRSAKVTSPGGTLAAFGEDNLGGVTMRVMLSIRK